MGKRISQVHMNNSCGVHLGEGKMNISSILRALEDIGFNGWLILETQPTDDPIAACRKNVEYLRKLL